MANGLRAIPQQQSPLAAQIAQLEQQIAMLQQRGGAQPNAREQGLLGAPLRMSQQPPSGFGAPGGADKMRQIYGLLAQYGDDPAAVGNQYVGAVQTQQQLNQQNQPIEQYLRLYGNVNPYDFETSSLSKFHENFVDTGQLDFNLLQRKEDLTTKEQGFLNEAINKAQKAEMDLGRMADISNRFAEYAARGNIHEGRLAGGLSEWLKGMLGSEDAVSQLRTEYEQLRTTNVIQNLPPGVASDRDIEIVMRGWPTGVADPAYIAAFLRGMQKLRAIDHAAATHSAAYLSRERTQQGQLDDWLKNRNWLTGQALERFGGVYNPEGMSAEEAARARYASTTQAPAGGYQIAPGQGPGTPKTEDELKAQYGID